MIALAKYLDDLERRIDPAVEDRLQADWRRFTFEGSAEPIFRPARQRAIPAGVAWPAVNVNDAIEDFDSMALQQFKGCSDLLVAGGGT